MLSATADCYDLTHRSRRTGTCWIVSGWPTLRWRSGSRSCSRLKASITPSAWSCSLQTQSADTSAILSATRREKFNR